jgi:hypothetical protein
MAEPDYAEFHEHVGKPDGQQPRSPVSRSKPVRIGIVAGSAVLVVIAAVAAMGASPAPSSSTANPGASAVPEAPSNGTEPDGGLPGKPGFGLRGGGFEHRGFRDITISAINGSSLSLKTDDGWTRTITVGSSTPITKGGQTIAIGDLKVGDHIVFGESKATDGSYTITAIRVVLPVVGGQVTAVNGDTITVTEPGGATGTIHVGSTTTYHVNGNASAKLSDITVGSIVVAEGTLRSDGSLDATAVHGGMRGGRGGGWGGPKFRVGPGPETNPSATPSANSSAS